MYDSEVVVKTKQNANYDQLLDESTYTDGYDYDWAYTLSQWVPFYFSNKYISHVMGKKERTEEFKMQFDPEMDAARHILEDSMNQKPKSQPKPKPKAILKCHFCNLRYCIENERKEHESFWHSNRLGRKINLLIVWDFTFYFLAIFPLVFLRENLFLCHFRGNGESIHCKYTNVYRPLNSSSYLSLIHYPLNY